MRPPIVTRVCVATGTPRGLAPHPATVQTRPTAAAIAAVRRGFVALWRLLPTLGDHIEAPAATNTVLRLSNGSATSAETPGCARGAETIRASAPPSSSRSVNDLRVLRSRTVANVPTDDAGSVAPPTLDPPAAVRAVRHPVGEVDLEQQPLGECTSYRSRWLARANVRADSASDDRCQDSQRLPRGGRAVS